MKPIRAIFFDLDDTLGDDSTSYPEALAQTCRELAARDPAVQAERLAEGFRQASEVFWRQFDMGTDLSARDVRRTLWRGACEWAGLPADEARIQAAAQVYTRIRVAGHRWLPGAKEALRQLCGRYRLALITNGASEIQREKIEALGVAELCPDIFIAQECKCSKPGGAIFGQALREVGVTPEESIMVGDRPDTDMAGAHAAGMRMVWVKPREERPWPADLPPPWLRIDGVAELPTHLL